MKNHWKKTNQEKNEIVDQYNRMKKMLESNAEKWEMFLHSFKNENKYQTHFKEKCVILENVRLMMEMSPPDFNPNKIIELTLEILKDLPIFDLVSVQPMLSCVISAFYKKSTQMFRKDICAKTKIITRVSSETFDNISELGLQIKNSIISEVLKDLRNNVGISVDGDDFCHNKKLIEDIEEMNNKINEKTSRKNDMWIVTNKTIAKQLLQHCILPIEYCESTKHIENLKFCQYVGFFENKYQLFVDPNLESNEILCGASYTEDNMIDGYFYCPYVLLNVSKELIINRYAKALVNNNYYGKIKYD